MKIISALIVAVILSGCGMGYVISTYGKVPVEEVDVNQSTYRLFHRPDLKKIMVTPSIGKAMASGFSLMIYDPSKSKGMDMAVDAYLKKAGYEGCAIKRGEEVMNEQIEFIYSCATVSESAVRPPSSTSK